MNQIFNLLTYYFSIPVDHQVYQGNLRNCIKDPNPYVKQTKWKWNIEPYGLKHLLDDYYHRYQLPILNFRKWFRVSRLF